MPYFIRAEYPYNEDDGDFTSYFGPFDTEADAEAYVTWLYRRPVWIAAPERTTIGWINPPQQRDLAEAREIAAKRARSVEAGRRYRESLRA